MDIKLNGIKVSVDEAAIAAIVRQHLLGAELPVARLSCRWHSIWRCNEVQQGAFSMLP